MTATVRHMPVVRKADAERASASMCSLLQDSRVRRRRTGRARTPRPLLIHFTLAGVPYRRCRAVAGAGASGGGLDRRLCSTDKERRRALRRFDRGRAGRSGGCGWLTDPWGPQLRSSLTGTHQALFGAMPSANSGPMAGAAAVEEDRRRRSGARRSGRGGGEGGHEGAGRTGDGNRLKPGRTNGPTPFRHEPSVSTRRADSHRRESLESAVMRNRPGRIFQGGGRFGTASRPRSAPSAVSRYQPSARCLSSRGDALRVAFTPERVAP